MILTMTDYRSAPRRTNESPIARMRIAKGLTQAQLAEKIGTHQQNIARWENGTRNPGSKSLLLLAKALECSLDDLVSF